MIVVTGALGFIGSALVWGLNNRGHDDILLVDNLDGTSRRNIEPLRYTDVVDQKAFINNLDAYPNVTAVFHMGACSDTMETDESFLIANNTQYTQTLAEWCLDLGARYVYASSAATYGDGEQGYDDDAAALESLKPLNLYGKSKHDFDIIARDKGWLEKMVGLKFFNVYGPNEYHKARMASVVMHAFPQAKDGNINLFKSYKDGFADGEQLRDFVYVKDVVDASLFFLDNQDNPKANGLFNIGTGQARSFKDLALAVFKAMNHEPTITYIDMPEALQGKYQYYTQANVARLREAGFSQPFTTLEDAVADYVTNYLAKDTVLTP